MTKIITTNLQTGEVIERLLTPQEILDMPPPDATPSIAQQIATLEQQAGMVKAVRKFMLTAMESEAIKQGLSQGLNATQSLALLRSKNAGYAGVKALDEQIEALEAQL